MASRANAFENSWSPAMPVTPARCGLVPAFRSQWRGIRSGRPAHVPQVKRLRTSSVSSCWSLPTHSDHGGAAAAAPSCQQEKGVPGQWEGLIQSARTCNCLAMKLYRLVLNPSLDLPGAFLASESWTFATVKTSHWHPGLDFDASDPGFEHWA